MNLHDVPMVLFTVVTQMSVGTFIALGVIQLLARHRDLTTTERVISPVLYAVGPALVFGLAVSMLHMNDVTHVFNVIRHWDSSWLSREILFGVAFGAFGFGFALLEWFGAGSRALRQTIAIVTAVLGIGLVWSQAMVYYSLVTVPAWHTWAVPVQFFTTTVLLGVLAVGGAMMVTAQVRAKRAAADLADPSEAPSDVAAPPEQPAGSGGGLAVLVRSRIREINAPSTGAEWTLTARVLKGIAVVGSVAAITILVVYPLYLGQLGQGDAAAQTSAAVFSGTMFWLRLVLTGLTAVLLGFFVYRMAESTMPTRSRLLADLVLLCLLLAVVGELLGRALHYSAMTRVGM